MAQLMSRPFKHPVTGVYYFRKAVPADLRAAIGKAEVKQSLRTKDRAEALDRFAKVSAEVAASWKRIRAKQAAPATAQGLSKRDALALAREWYVWFTAQHEDDPGEGDADFGWLDLAKQC